MRNFSLKTKQSSRLTSGRRALLFTCGLIVTAVFAVVVFRELISSATAGALTLALRIRTYMAESTAVFPVYVRSRNELANDIRVLKETISSQSGNNATILRLTRENEELRALRENVTGERVLAGVIARPPFVPYDVMVIDQGEDMGIREGALVYHQNNHVLGIVTKVFRRSAVVTLMSSYGAESTVYLFGPNVFVRAYGEGGGVIRLSVPQGVTVSVGDPVVLPGVEGSDLGVVERVQSVETEPEQSAYLTFPVPIQSIRVVSVSTEPTPPIDGETFVPDTEAIRARFSFPIPESSEESVPTTSSATTS